MSAQVRVRFAPSPTGYLHVGGARTALFNWLFARANKGKFLLRIEDTDEERSEQKFIDDIQGSLRWLGFEPDEAPLFQSTRLGRHQEFVDKLLAQGKAYRCDCSQEKLDAIRKQCQKEKRTFLYPGTCRNKTEVATPHVVRVKTPREGHTTFQDQIRGEITVANKDLDDWVIARSSGIPTYNFVVVIDDSDQGVTHVLRGEDHINNTPKQVLLCKALGVEPPQYAHLPMILGPDKSKLSKRHGAVSTLEYRRMGYLPEAILNFLARLGWSHGDQEIFSIDELQRYFSLQHVGKANAVFNSEKLIWLNGHYLREKEPQALVEYMKQYFASEMTFTHVVEADRLQQGVAIIQGKVKTIPELIEQLSCLFGADPQYDLSQVKSAQVSLMTEILRLFLPIVEASDFASSRLEEEVRQKSEEMGKKFGKVAQALRFAVTGGKVTPGLFEMLSLQGKETVVRRLKAALVALESINGT